MIPHINLVIQWHYKTRQALKCSIGINIREDCCVRSCQHEVRNCHLCHPCCNIGWWSGDWRSGQDVLLWECPDQVCPGLCRAGLLCPVPGILRHLQHILRPLHMWQPRQLLLHHHGVLGHHHHHHSIRHNHHHGSNNDYWCCHYYNCCCYHNYNGLVVHWGWIICLHIERWWWCFINWFVSSQSISLLLHNI